MDAHIERHDFEWIDQTEHHILFLPLELHIFLSRSTNKIFPKFWIATSSSRVCSTSEQTQKLWIWSSCILRGNEEKKCELIRASDHVSIIEYAQKFLLSAYICGFWRSPDEFHSHKSLQYTLKKLKKLITQHLTWNTKNLKHFFSFESFFFLLKKSAPKYKNSSFHYEEQNMLKSTNSGIFFP